MQNSSNGSDLLKAIQMYDFYLVDLGLFLDTHPNDVQALAKFNEIKEKLQAAVSAYAAKYGPLTFEQNNSAKAFYWVDGPWPWERSAN